MLIIREEDYIAHTGVKGMKWGKRQKVEASNVTEAKGALTKNKQSLKEAHKAYNRQTALGFLPPSQQSLKRLAGASLEVSYSKQDLAGVKILNRFKVESKSPKQLETEAKYKKQGMTDDEATVEAYKNIRTKKILMGVGVAALTVAAGYAAYKIHDTRVDKIIKSGTLLQNISAESNAGIRDAFYSSSNKLDQIKYKGLYGNQLTAGGGKAYSKQVRALTDIKQASPANAKKEFANLMRTDKDFYSDVAKYISPEKSNLGANYAAKTIEAQKSIFKGKINKNAYEVFNANLVDHSPEMQKITDTYFKSLSKKGYNALKDVNDSKYSGYKAVNPIIAFNTSGKVDVKSVTELTEKNLNKKKNMAMGALMGSELLKTGAMGAAGILAIKGGTSLSTKKSNAKVVADYKVKNPNSKLSNTEIERMLKRRQINGS